MLKIKLQPTPEQAASFRVEKRIEAEHLAWQSEYLCSQSRYIQQQAQALREKAATLRYFAQQQRIHCQALLEESRRLHSLSE